MTDTSGLLDDGAEPKCPVCGVSLGYCAELGDDIECDNCKTKMYLDRLTSIHYYIYETGDKNDYCQGHSN